MKQPLVVLCVILVSILAAILILSSCVMAAENVGVEATPELIDKVVSILVEEKQVRMDRAVEVIKELEGSG